MKVLVTAASKYGSTAEIAQAIGQTLAADGLGADVIPPDQVETSEDYDAVVLGSAVYTGHWLAPAKAIAARLEGSFAERPVWLFSSGPVGEPTRRLVQKMAVDRSISRRSAARHGLASIACSPASSRSATSGLLRGPRCS
jgi:menaquinone-dependent protoporphyrinogen oxidase